MYTDVQKSLLDFFAVFPHPCRSEFLMESKQHQSRLWSLVGEMKEFWPLLPPSPPPCSSSPFRSYLLPFPHQTHNFPFPARCHNFSSYNKARLLRLLSARGGRDCSSNNMAVKHDSEGDVKIYSLVCRAENCSGFVDFKIKGGKYDPSYLSALIKYIQADPLSQTSMFFFHIVPLD